MEFLYNLWGFFSKNILQQPAFFIALIVLVGYILLKKPWYDSLAGFIKASVGYLILIAGAGGLVLILLLIDFIFNILLVRFQKIIKLRALFTTGHV